MRTYLSRGHEKIGQADRNQVFGYGNDRVSYLEAVHQPCTRLVTRKGANHTADAAQHRPSH